MDKYNFEQCIIYIIHFKFKKRGDYINPYNRDFDSISLEGIPKHQHK